MMSNCTCSFETTGTREYPEDESGIANVISRVESPDCPAHATPRTLTQLREWHHFETSHDGDGYHEPYSTWVGCTCGVMYYAHMQHAGECDERCDYPDGYIEQLHVEHVLAMAIRARLARSNGARR